MFHEQQQLDAHILAILVTQKHCFKVRYNTLSYKECFAPFLFLRDDHFRKNLKPLDV